MPERRSPPADPGGVRGGAPAVAAGSVPLATTGAGPVLTLAAMHLTTVLITVPACARVLPLPRTEREAAAGRRTPSRAHRRT